MGKEDWEKQESSEIWLPKEDGDELIGEVLLIETEGLYGKQFVIKTEKDELKTPSHKVLQNRMAKVKVGDNVKIIYKGEEPPKIRGQNPMKMYDVFIKK